MQFDEPLIDRKKACEFLFEETGIRYSPKTLTKYCSTGAGPQFYKIGNRVYYSKKQLLNWIESRISACGAAASETSTVANA